MVKDFAFVAYPAKDVPALRKFYSDALGFKFNDPFAEDGVEKYADAQVGGGWFAVVTTEWAEIAPTGGAAFEVDDMDQTVKDLREKGVEVPGVYDTPVCKIATFSDPEGNKVTLHQITVPH